MADQQAQVVYSEVAEGSNLQGQLFEGKKFWVAQRCPSRNRFVEQIRSNGGQVVPLEKQADFLIADHARKDVPPGSLSYRFIEQSIRDSELADPEDHLAGPPRGAPRDVGSVRPPRTGRVAYTQEDDRQLYKWVKDYERKGGAILGNEIYKQLEQLNPRHTWQSWRDRYVKTLQHRPASAVVPANAPPSPPSDRSIEQPTPRRPEEKRKHVKDNTGDGNNMAGTSAQPQSTDQRVITGEDATEAQSKRVKFTREDYEELYANVELIKSTPFGEYINNWEGFANGTPQTAEQWREYFENTVMPRWNKDPQSRRDEIQKKVNARHEANGTQSYLLAGSQLEQIFEKNSASSLSPQHASRSREAKGKQRAESSEPIIFSPEPRHGRVHSQDTALEGNGRAALEIERPETPNALLQRLMLRLVKERGGEKPIDAYKFWAEEQKAQLQEELSGMTYVERHALLISRWNALSAEDQEVYRAMEVADRKRYEMESGTPSEAQGGQTEDIVYTLTELHENSRKRRRNIDEGDSDPRPVEDLPGAKRPRQESPLFVSEQITQEQVEMTLETGYIVEEDGSAQIEASARHNEQLAKQQAEQSEIPGAAKAQTKRPNPYTIFLSSDDEQEPKADTVMHGDVQQDTQSSEHQVDAAASTQPETQDSIFQDSVFGPDLDIAAAVANLAESEERSSTPTPRAPRHKNPAFETQAILSSPSQPFEFSLAMPEGGFTQTPSRSPEPILEQPSSPNRHPESVSTSQSIQEFRHNLDPEPSRSFSPTLDFTTVALPEDDYSDANADIHSIATSEEDPDPDPDPPLATAASVNTFFTSQQQAGYSRDITLSALQRTSLQPELAQLVLQAWDDGKELPNRRGVWSETEDDWLEGSDSRKLKRLDEKHTWDGWGGCQERQVYLEKARAQGRR